MSSHNLMATKALPFVTYHTLLTQCVITILTATIACLPQTAVAHALSTNTITIDDPDAVNASSSFVLLDPGGFDCPTLVSITVDPATAVMVTPAGPITVTGSQLFVVTPLQGSGVIPNEIKITVMWAHGPAPADSSNPCYQAMDAGEAAQGTGIVTLTVGNPLALFNESQANLAQAAQATDPVNTHTGELFFTEMPDLRYFYQPMPLIFQRYYASHLRRWLVVGRMGDNWRHTYEWTLRNVGNTLQIVDHEGRQTRYLQPDTIAGDWVQQNNFDVPLEVIQTTDGETIWYVLDPRNGFTYVFSVPGVLSEFKLTSIEDGKGNVQNLTYDGDGLLTAVSDLFGRSILLSYDPTEPNVALKKVTGITDGTRIVTYSYEVDNLVRVVDANGGETQYLYDTAHPDPGLLERKIWPNGNFPWRQTFDALGRVETQTDSLGNVSGFTYEQINGTKTTLTRPDGLTEIHEHSNTGELTKSTDANSSTSNLANTGTTARGETASPNGGVFAASYDGISGKVTSETFASGQTTAYGYSTRVDARGFSRRDLTSVIFPDGSTKSFSYDGSGNRLSQTDQDGDIATFEYDGFGRVTKASNPLGGQTTHSYDAAGNRVSSTDPAGNTTTMAYDGFDRITTITHADGSTRSYTYDALDRKTSQTLESGSTTTLAFDANGNLLSITDPNGNARTITYDSNNNLTSLTDRLGNTTTYVYDSLNRIIKNVYADGREATYTYRGTDNVDRITDATGRSNALTYDSTRRLLSRSDSDGNTTSYMRDLQGQITSSTTPQGNTTSYEYDLLGRMIRSTEPSGKVTANTFEKSGWIRSITLGGGASTLMERNGMDQINRFTSAMGGVRTYQYDTSGRVTSTTDPIGNVTTYTYDSRNRVSRVTYPGFLGSVDYTYNPFGHITERVWAGGPAISNTYDILGRLTTTDAVAITYDANSRIVGSNGMTMTRDTSGRMTALTLAAGKTVTYTYDAASGDLLSVTDWGGVSTFIGRDNRSNVSEINRGNGSVTTYAYDSLDRRILIDHGFASYAVTRNVDGQISAVDRVQALKADLPVSDGFTYDIADRALEFNYDALGRVIDDGTRTYTYDGASRLVRVVSTSDITYDYNGFGHIVSRTEVNNTREYVWNHAITMPVISIVRDNGADTRYYIHTPSGRLLYSIDAMDNSRLYYHYDERGNTVALSNDAGDIVTMYAYDPFGRITTSAVVDNPFTFAGLYGVIFDPLGFYHMQRRVMDPSTGRFLTPEPIMPHIYPQNNVYGYAANDPVNIIDPSGTTPTPQEVAEGALDAGRSGTQVAGMLGDVKAGQAADATRDMLKFMGEVNLFGPEGQAGANRAWQAMNDMEKAADTANDLNRAAEPLQAAGRVGRGLQALDIALTMNKLRNDLNETSEDYDAATRGAIASYAGRVETVFQIYHRKQKTLTWLEAQLRIQYGLMQLELIHSSFLYDVNFMLDIWVAYANGLGSFVPGFTGLDPDAGNNVGFFFF